MTTANFEGFAFRLTGVTTGPGSTIPVGTALEQVVLTTRDLLTGLTPDVQDRDMRIVITGEGVNFLVNGVLLTATAPILRAVQLTTDVGSFPALVFTVGNDSFALVRPGVNLSASVLTQAATVNQTSFGGFDPLTYGLLPEGANTYAAQTFNTQDFGGSNDGLPDHFSLGTATLYDTDLIRGNGETIRTSYVETLSTLLFSDGSILGGVETLRSGGYSGYVTSYSHLFDEAALAASGHTIEDVRAVLNSFAFDHQLSWDGAGFTLVSGPATDAGGDDVPPPPPPPPSPNVINGTSRSDVIIGTAGRDLIRGFDRNDTMTGGDGHDAFIFGTDSRSGRKSVDVITDYQVGEDFIALEAGSSVRNIRAEGDTIVIRLVGDGDQIVIRGADLTVDDIAILDHPISFEYI